MIENDVCVDGVTSIDTMTWKPVPKFPNLYASASGKIAIMGRDGHLTHVSEFESATSQGTYKVVAATGDQGVKKIMGVHFLVCSTYHGERSEVEGIQYDVNHDDGDKHNNSPGNLSWVTHSDNCIHAVENDLRKDNIFVEVKDVVTGSVEVFRSINHLSEKLNIPRYHLYSLIGRHRDAPYLERWVFNFDPARLGLVDRKQAVDVMAYDHVDCVWIVANSLNSLALLTGVEVAFIKESITKRKRVAGFTFRYYLDDVEVLPVDQETARIERDAVFSREIVRRNNPIIIKDYRTGNEIEVVGVREAMATTGLSRSTVVEQCCGIRKSLAGGYFCQYAKEDIKFPEVSQEDIAKSLVGVRSNTKVFEIADLSGNVTKKVYGLRSLVSELGLEESVASYSRLSLERVNDLLKGRGLTSKFSISVIE